MENTNIIKDLRVFKDISVRNIPPLLQCVGAFQKNYLKTEYVIFYGSRMEQIGLILAGTVQVIKEDYWGNKVIIAVLYPGDILGESIASGETNGSIVSFQAAEDCQILFFSFKQALCSCSRSCSYHQQFIENLMAGVSNKNVRLMNKMEILSKKTIRERILTYLSQKVQTEHKTYIHSELGRVDLADYLCVDRSALTRELNRMKEEGIIDFDKNTFLIK